MEGNSEPKKLRRSRSNKVLGGILAGIGEYFDLDPVLIRVIYCFLTLFTAAFPGVLMYIVMLILIPADNRIQ
ncbi:MAG: PspC domain-containing protein [Bacteroidales bacterium]|nr:PspC domain-containing protein [Bacteroidales bacterium]